MNRVAAFFNNLLFPPKCVSCGEFIQKDVFDPCEVPFCEKCRIKWEREKLEICPDCGLEMMLCNCGAPLMKKSGVCDYVKLIGYSVKNNGVGKRALLYLKRHKNRRAFDYFASQLAYSVSARMKRLDADSFVVAYAPRGYRSLALYGFDQSRELSERLAKKLGVPCVKIFRRAINKNLQQKKLNLAQRRENAKSAYSLTANAEAALMSVDCVLLVDDVITSGASLYGCVSALKDIYGKKIICVTLARTANKNKK